MFGVKAPQIMMFGLMIPAGYGVSADFLLELMINADMKGEGTMAMPRLGKKKAAPARNVKKAAPRKTREIRAMPKIRAIPIGERGDTLVRFNPEKRKKG